MRGPISILKIVWSIVLLAWCGAGGGLSYADDFDQLRLKRRDMLTQGTNASSTHPSYSNWIASVAGTAQRHWNNLNTAPNRSYLWSDRNHLSTDSSDISASYSRLQLMALAYSIRTSPLENNASLLTAITNALDWLYANHYNETKPEFDNFYDWEIAIPLDLNDTTVLLYHRLSPTQVANYMRAVEHFSPEPNLTAANKAWKTFVVAIRGAIVKDPVKIELSRQALSELFLYTASGDGFYPDGSFIFHEEFAYNGGYGAQMLETIAPLMQWLQGSSWEITDPNQANFYRWIYDAFQPLIYKGAMMQMVSGRYYTRLGDDHVDGHDLIAAILRTAQFAPPHDAAAFKSMVKAWIQGDNYRSFLSTQPPPYNVWAQEVLNNPSIPPTPELVRHYQFPNMDRVIHHRPGWAFGVAMSSSRVGNYESIRGENLRGWYTGDGMTYLYNSDLAYYADSFWPTINHYRLPGTTVDTMPRNNGSGQSYTSPNNWTGGASLDNLFGVAGMQLNAWGSTLSARKSWFMFDNEVVCLGAGISSTDNRSVETIVENRRLSVYGNNPLAVNGLAQSSSLGWSQTLTNPQSAHLAGNAPGSDIGFYFPQPTTLHALREARTGAMVDLNTTYGATNRVTRNFLTLWIDHGISPSNANYAYVLLPNASSSQVADYARAPEIQVLGNSTTAQGVRENTLGITAVNFWRDGTNRLGGITVDKKASVIIRNDGTFLDVGISDPTHTNTGLINLEFTFAAATMLSGDPAFSVQQLSPTLKVAVNMEGSSGATRRARFFVGAVQTVTLSPEADAYVQNGDQAGINFGSSISLAAKAAANSQGRESFLRFDLSSTPGLVFSANLRLLPFTINDPLNHALAHVPDDSWAEDTITWNNKPVSEIDYTQWLLPAVNTPVIVPITTLAQQAASGDGKLSLRVYSTGTPAPVNGGYTAYASREHGTAANRPQLILTIAHTPPTITLSNLSGVHLLDAPASVTLGANTWDSDGVVTNVSFYKGNTRLAQMTSGPYHFTPPTLAAGQHTFTAVAIDNAGIASTSAPVVLTVYNPEPQGRGTGLTGEYFTTPNLVGLAVTRIDPVVNFSWGTSTKPDGAISVDNYSVRWSGKLQARHAGIHQFHLVSDEGARLWIGGQLVIDNWTSHTLSEDIRSISLVPGEYYDLVLEYYENTGPATAQLLWTEPGGARQVIPQSQFYPAMGGLRGFYYASTNFTKSAFYRVDDVVNFSWGTSSPDPALLQGVFSVKWNGKIRANQTGLYTFYTLSDDAVKLIVNNQTIISNWVPHTVTENSGSISLTAGQSYNIAMEFFNANGNATAVLMWQPPGETKQVIPTANLAPYQNNYPPVLASIPNFALSPGRSLAFDNTAADPDLPYQSLSYSLEPGAPSGLTLNPSTGQFHWSIPANQAPGNYTITVRVTDNGNPVMTDAQSFIITVTSNLTSAYFTLLPTGSVWKYLDSGNEPSSSWKTQNFNDNSWKTGSGPLGYGTGAEATQLSFGSNPSAKHPTTYLRKLFYVPDASKVLTLDARLLRNDGVVVYLNGNEIWRDNLPSGAISNQTLASVPITGIGSSALVNQSLSPSLLLDGTNCLAVEIHQSAPDGPDIAFDLELKGFVTSPLQAPLGIGRATNLIHLTWAAEATWLQLFTTTDLAPPPIWTKATNTPSFSNGRWSLQIPTAGRPAQFFKLQLP